MSSRTFCVAALKGGVGKTTIAAALARQLRGSVAMMDLDFANPVLHIALGIPHRMHDDLPGYKIAPVPWGKGELASLAMLTMPGGIMRQSSEHRVALLLDFIRSVTWQPHDYMVIDTAPSLSQENDALLREIDPEVIIVAEPGPLAAEGVVRTALFMRAVGARVLGLLGNRGLEARDMAERLGIEFLGTVPQAPASTQVEVPDITRFRSSRLNRSTWASRIKREAVKMGLEAYLMAEETQR